MRKIKRDVGHNVVAVTARECSGVTEMYRVNRCDGDRGQWCDRYEEHSVVKATEYSDVTEMESTTLWQRQSVTERGVAEMESTML